MVPSAFVFVESLPLTPNGKIDRRALPVPDPTSRDTGRDYVAPTQTVEHQLVHIWEELLTARPIGVRDNFFDLGGHSLLAAKMVQRIEEVCGEKVPLSVLLAAPTIEHLANELVKEAKDRGSLLVKIQSGGNKPPFFFLHADHRGGGFYCLDLARGLGADQPFYALAPLDREGDPSTIEEMATLYLEVVREIEPRGPYVFGGVCHGGVVAYEMARQLKREGEKVELVVMIGPSPLASPRMRFLRDMLSGVAHWLRLGPEETVGLFLLLRGRWALVHRLYQYLRSRLKKVAKLPLGAQSAWALSLTRRIAMGAVGGLVPIGAQAQAAGSDERGSVPTVQSRAHSNILVRQIAKYGLTEKPVERAIVRYSRRPYRDRVAIFWPVEQPIAMPSRPVAKWAEMKDRSLGWRHVVSDLEIHELPGTRISSVTKGIDILVDRVKACLDKVPEIRNAARAT
jgi:hypothetical protein